jgi:hypothetical protein
MQSRKQSTNGSQAYDDLTQGKRNSTVSAALSKLRKPRSKPLLPKTIQVHFQKATDVAKFAVLIRQSLNASPSSRKLTFSAKYNARTKAISITNAAPKQRCGFSDHGRKEYRPKKRTEWNTDWFFRQHWIEMPPFEQERSVAWITYKVTFQTEEDFACFARLIKQPLSFDTNAIWFPEKSPSDYTTHWWVSEDGKPNQPRYPIFIPSKGRAHKQMTMRTLSRMGLKYYVMVEPQEYEEYRRFVPPEATVLKLSRGNHGMGPGLARNECWDYAKNVLKAKRFFILDDNIDGFYRLHQNKRYRCGDGTPFRALEDFVDRYKNVPLAGFQYRFFKAPDQKHYPFTVNTRIYSAALMSTDNDDFKQRGRYNEDTIQSIDVMEAKQCTVEFNSFLQGKLRTQTMKGGNTDEFYRPQGKKNQAKSTFEKSAMLVREYPKICKMVFRYERWHHDCDYTVFRKNQLKRTDAWIMKLKKRRGKLALLDPYKLKLVPIPKQ